MNITLLYLGILVILICIFSVIYIIIYNKYQDEIIRINEVESAIDSLIRNKYDIMNQAISIIKGNIDSEKEIFEEIIKIKSRKISNFDLDRKLVEASNEWSLLKNEYPQLNDSEELHKIFKGINKTDEKLKSLKEYYDKNIAIYNKLIRSFPSNVVGLICKYKEKLFFDKKDMSDDNYQDFKL